VHSSNDEDPRCYARLRTAHHWLSSAMSRLLIPQLCDILGTNHGAGYDGLCAGGTWTSCQSQSGLTHRLRSTKGVRLEAWRSQMTKRAAPMRRWNVLKLKVSLTTSGVALLERYR
jgi:hypothetical protein